MSLERYEVIASYPETGAEVLWSLATVAAAKTWADTWYAAQPDSVRDGLRAMWITDSVTGKVAHEY